MNIKVKKISKQLFSVLLTIILISTTIITVNAKKRALIVLDPGHGTNYEYHVFELDGVEYAEYQLNFTIAEFLYDILSNYDEIDVRMTKNTEEEHPELRERVVKAKKYKKQTGLPTYLISLHNNARSDGGTEVVDDNRHGCMVLASNLNYKAKTQEKIDDLSYNIIGELSQLGLYVNYPDKNGILRRTSEVGKYPNGKKRDYYGLIRHGVLQNIPTIIVEHAYMTDINDSRNFLLSDEGLKKLAIADAKAIVAFLGLEWNDDFVL